MKKPLSFFRRLKIKLEVEKTLWQMVFAARKGAPIKAARQLRRQERKARRSTIGRRLNAREKGKGEITAVYIGPPSKGELTQAINELFDKLYKEDDNSEWLHILHEKMQRLHPDALSTKKKSEKLVVKSNELLKKTETSGSYANAWSTSFEKKVLALEAEAVRTQVPPLGPVRLRLYDWAEEVIKKRELKAAQSYENVLKLLSEEFGGLYGVIEESIKKKEEVAENAKKTLTALFSNSSEKLKDCPDPSGIEDLFLVIRVTKSIRDNLADKEDAQIQKLVSDIDTLIESWLERLEVLVKRRGEIVRNAKSSQEQI